MGKKMENAPVYYVLAQVRFNAVLALEQYVPAIQDSLRKMGFPDYEKAVVATLSEDLAHIKGALKLTIGEIAECVGVSRQALYNWKSGASVKLANAARFENLKAATDVVSATGLSLSSMQMKRKLPGGKSLLETISVGEDGKNAATALVTMLVGEASRQAELAARFAGRRPVSTDDDDAPPVFNG